MRPTQVLQIVRECLPARYLHGDVQVGEVRNNFSMFNGEYFIKVAGKSARPGGIDNELKIVSYLISQNYTNVTMPALAASLPTPIGEASVWHFFHGKTPKHEELNAQNFLASMQQLIELHELQLSHPELPSLKCLKTGPERRRTLEAWGNMPQDLARDIELLISAFVSPIDGKDFTGREVLCHGDPHVGNLMLGDNAVVWCDWESAVMSPKEYDIAAMRHNILRIGGRHDLWEKALPYIEDYDPDLIDELEMAKATLGVTYVISHGAYDIARQRVDALLPVLDGGPLPERLAFFQ